MQSTVGDFIGETSAIASIGDPLRVNTGQPGVTLTAGPGGPVVTTPAPGSSLLLLIGLLLVVTSRLRRS